MPTKLVRVAAALLVRQGRLLLAHRSPARRWYPDCWDLVGGHIEDGETPEDAVRREVLEEIGVELYDVHPMPMTFTDPAIEMHAFVATSWRGEPANLAPEEHDDLRWFQPEELTGLVLADPASLPDLVSAATADPAPPSSRR